MYRFLLNADRTVITAQQTVQYCPVDQVVVAWKGCLSDYDCAMTQVVRALPGRHGQPGADTEGLLQQRAGRGGYPGGRLGQGDTPIAGEVTSVQVGHCMHAAQEAEPYVCIL